MIGGNNEVGDMIFQLPFGGWVTPDIFFAGINSQIYFGDLLITCQSGIMNGQDYHKCISEKFPVRGCDTHLILHIREVSIFQLYGLKNVPLFVSHEWPSGIPKQYRNIPRMQFYAKSDDKNDFGCPGFVKLLNKHRPKKWYAAHLHVRFDCTLKNGTKFTGVPKVIDKRYKWYELEEYNCNPAGGFKFSGEWINIVKNTERFVKNPKLLQNLDWDEEWRKIYETMNTEDFPEKVDVMEYNDDYQIQTKKFCDSYQIYNPYKI